MSITTQSISKDVVKNMLIRAKADIKLITIPYLEKINSKVSSFKSEDANRTLDELSFNLNVRVKRENITSLLIKTVKDSYKLIDFIMEQADEILQDKMFSTSLTAKQITIIRVSTYFYELTDRVMDFYEYLIVSEISEAKKQDRYDYYDSPYFKSKLSTAIRFLNKFINTFNTLSNKDLEAIIKDVPDVIINATNSDAMVALYGQNKLFPINLESHVAKEGFVSDLMVKWVIGTVNFIFKSFMWVYSLWTSYSVARYKQALERKKGLDLYLMELETINKGQPNPKLEKEIEYVQKRVQDLEYEIRDFETSIE